MVIKLNTRVLVFLLISFFFIDCSESTSEENQDLKENQQSSLSENKRYTVQNIFNSMPDHHEILKLIEENALQYNPDLLHDPMKYKNYNTEESMAFNLGVYGADLSITRLFNQTQESITFLKSLNFLAQKLGIQSVFSDQLFERLEQYKDIKDSSVQIMISAFSSADKILTESHRGKISSLMISGAWVEGFYVSCQFAIENNNISLARALLKQKSSLNEVLKMLETDSHDESAKFIYDNLITLSSVLDEQQEKLNQKPDQITESILPLSESILRIRERIVKMN